MAPSSSPRPGPGSIAELVDQPAAYLGDGAQRLALTAGAVLGEREQLPPALPQRGRVGQGLGLGEHVAVVAGLDGCLEPPFLGVETELGEPGCFQAAGLPLLELGERATAPQGERLAEGVRRPVGFAELEQLVAALGERLELARVHSVGGEGEPVPGAGRLDRAGSEDLAQPHDAALQVLVPGGGRRVSPDRLGELVGAERLVPGRGQRGEDDSVAGAQAGRRVVERERSQDRNTHASNVLAASGAVNRVDTGRIPGRGGVDTDGWHNGTSTGHQVPASPQENIMNSYYH